MAEEIERERERIRSVRDKQYVVVSIKVLDIGLRMNGKSDLGRGPDGWGNIYCIINSLENNYKKNCSFKFIYMLPNFDW